MISLKNDQEIDLMRVGGRKLAKILARLEKMVEPGLKTIELDKAAQAWAREEGAKPSFLGFQGFPAGLCVSLNEEIVHGIPGQREIKEGDLVSLDFGLEYQGYFTDMAITMGVGRLEPGAKEILEVTRECLNLAIAEFKIGQRLGAVSAAIQKHAEAAGMSVVRDLVGHGVGRKVHEPPQVPNFGRVDEGMKIEKGLTVAIEPMVNLGESEVVCRSDGWTCMTADKKLSAHFEHTVAPGENGGEILTKIE